MAASSGVKKKTLTSHQPRVGHWQEFIDREKTMLGESRLRSGSVGEDKNNALPNKNVAALKMSVFNTGSLNRNSLKSRNTDSSTMPRIPKSIQRPPQHLNQNFDEQLRIVEDELSFRSSKSPSSSPEKVLPPGIRELETLYAPMKDLSEPLPGQSLSPRMMPAPHPIWNPSSNIGLVRPMRDEDAESEICSVIIPPALPPVQSHALLEGLPRTPIRSPKFPDWKQQQQQQSHHPQGPPIPPKRTNSKLSLLQKQRPTNLSLSEQPSNSSAIYANVSKALLHRTSLMSTGSSENSSSNSSGSDNSSIPSVAGEVIHGQNSNNIANSSLNSTSALLPGTPSSRDAETTFSWPSYSVNQHPNSQTALLRSTSPSPSEEHRSVSQIGIDSEDSNSSSLSNVYAKMLKSRAEGSRGDSHYMNVLYRTAQQRGQRCSLNSTSSSPFIDVSNRSRSSVNVKNLPNVQTDDASTIYSVPNLRQRSSSTSRLQEVTNKARRKLRATSSSSNKKARAAAEFRELMREVERKRHFRVALNIFNSRPAAGVEYLVQRDFVELSPQAVARFLRECDGLSQEKVGEFLGDLRDPFAMKVLACYMQDFDFAGLRIDKALRTLLSCVRVPGEAQKVERLMEVFGRRYVECNPAFGCSRRSSSSSGATSTPADSAVTLAFACMLLNTDLHAPGVRQERRMKPEDFVTNLRGVDGGADFDQKLLRSIYRGIRKREFSGGSDHVAQSRAVERSLQGENRPPISQDHHRRLVCLCRLYEVFDLSNKKEDDSFQHPRDIFLFNDLLIVSKQMTSTPSKANCAAGLNGDEGPFYSFRDSIALNGLEVTLFHTPVYSHGVQLVRKRDEKVLATLNARSEHDRYKFVMDLQESIYEVELMHKIMAEEGVAMQAS